MDGLLDDTVRHRSAVLYGTSDAPLSLRVPEHFSLALSTSDNYAPQALACRMLVLAASHPQG
jgi:hypothetical protein